MSQYIWQTVLILFLLSQISIICAQTDDKTIQIGTENQKLCDKEDFRIDTTFAAKPIKSLADARKQLNQVLDAAEVSRSKVHLFASKVGGHLAVACQKQGKTNILFDAKELNKLINRGGNKWVIRSIFAHEAGHHAFAHIIKTTKRAKLELQADGFAGTVLARMKVPLDEAQKAYQAWIGEDNSKGQAYQEQAVTDQEQEVSDYPKPIDRLNAVKAAWKKEKTVIYKREGEKFASEKRYRLAIAEFSKAIKLDSTDAELFNSRGNSFISIGNYNKAIDDFTRVISLKPDFVEVYNNRGIAFLFTKRHNLAIADFTQYINLDPKTSHTFFNRGNAYKFTKRYKLAIADYTQAIKLGLKTASVYESRGLSRALSQLHDLAIADFTEVIILDSKNAEAYYNRGAAYYYTKDYQQAKRDIERAITLNPKIERFHKTLELVKKMLNQ